MGAQRGGGSAELRQGNLTQILRYLRDHGSSSRHDIARGCGLGVSTMTDLVGDLRSRRLVLELDPVRRPGAGRPTRPISLDGAPWCVLGVQVEADQVQVLAATVGGEELWRDTVPTRANGGHSAVEIAETVRAELDRVPEGVRLVALEVGVPGHVTGAGVVTSHVLSWTDIDLGDALRAMLAQAGLKTVRVGVSSDSHLAGLYVARTRLEQSSHALAAYFGGVGDVNSALVVDGEIFRGAAGGAGDLGHLHVAAEGHGCWCGRPGCLNALVRIEQLLARSELVTPAEASRLVREQPAKAVAVLVEAAEAGEVAVLEVLEEAGEALGRAFDDIIGTINPDAVILGGYLGQLAPYLMPAVERQLQVRTEEAPYAGTQILVLDEAAPQVAAGAVLAARDACLYDPLRLTFPLA